MEQDGESQHSSQPIPNVKDIASLRNRVLFEGQALKDGEQTVTSNGRLYTRRTLERISDPEAYHKALQVLAAHELETLDHVQLDTRIKILQMSIAYFAHALEYGSEGRRDEFQYCLRKYLEATFTPGAELDGEDGRRRNTKLRDMRRKCESWAEFLEKVKAYVVVEMAKLESINTLEVNID